MNDRLALEILGEARAPAELPRQGRLVIGSSKERADLVVEGAGVEAVHCAIGRLKEGGWALKDLGSDAGSHVNGERVSSVRLQAGDVIELGARRLRVFDPLAERPSPAPSSTHKTRVEGAPTPSGSPDAHAQPTPSRADEKDARVRIRGYTLERKLGRGAMGEVWLAIQESLSRKVAIKLLVPRLEADLDFVRRFQAEARAAAALNHPNVVTVHDVGEDTGHHYLTMEFMAHGCLESRVSTLGPVPWREVLGILRDAAAGLVYAEQRGIVHRDIKPANLMQDEHGVTKIADLGLAAQVEQEELQGERGKIFGTPHFLAPELIRGATPDARTDLYALGATAYRLLTGRTPFEGTTARDILRTALRDEPVQPAKLTPGIPAELERLVMKLLAKDPAQRLPSAAALLAEIESLRNATAATSAGPAGATGARRMRRLVVVMVVLALAVWGGLQLVPRAKDSDLSGTSRDGGPGGRTADPRGPGVPGVEPETDTPEVGDAGAGASEEANPGESAFVAREIEASEEHSELKNRVLTDADRIAALRALAARFEGTDTALVALREAGALETVTAPPGAAADPLTQAREAVLGALRHVAAAHSGPSTLAATFELMRAIPGQDSLSGDPLFLAERTSIERGVLDSSLAAAREVHARADELMRSGRFDEARGVLEGFAGSAHMPTFPWDDVPEPAREFDRLIGLAKQRLDNMDAGAREFADAERAREAQALAAALGGPGGLEAELARLDLAAAAKRIDAALASVRKESDRAGLQSLRAEIEAAQGALEALGKAWDRDEWRRKTISDPRPHRTAPLEAMGADEEGIWFEGENGRERLPWSAWGGQALELDKLFHGRLTRPWNAAELDGIAALLRFAAVVELTRHATAALDPVGDERFSEAEAEAALTSFGASEHWELGGASLERATSERAAAEALVQALRAADDGAWSRAVDHLEQLLGEHPASLLVLLRSDGTEWREVRAEPVAPPPDAEPTTGETPSTPEKAASKNDG